MHMASGVLGVGCLWFCDNSYKALFKFLKIGEEVPKLRDVIGGRSLITHSSILELGQKLWGVGFKDKF